MTFIEQVFLCKTLFLICLGRVEVYWTVKFIHDFCVCFNNQIINNKLEHEHSFFLINWNSKTNLISFFAN